MQPFGLRRSGWRWWGGGWLRQQCLRPGHASSQRRSDPTQQHRTPAHPLLSGAGYGHGCSRMRFRAGGGADGRPVVVHGHLRLWSREALLHVAHLTDRQGAMPSGHDGFAPGCFTAPTFRPQISRHQAASGYRPHALAQNPWELMLHLFDLTQFLNEKWSPYLLKMLWRHGPVMMHRGACPRRTSSVMPASLAATTLTRQ